MSPYDAVVFDNDGVLVHPPAPETQAAAVREAFAAVGVVDPDPDHVRALTGGVTVDLLSDLGSTYGVDPEALWAARERHDERSQLEAFRAGDRRTYPDVEVLADLPVPAGVVSNNHHTTVGFVLEHFGLEEAFDTYYGREMSVESLRRKKPNPHYLERALSDLGAASALYVGDSETDVLAADRAGVDAAFLRRDAGADTAADPTHEIESLRELPALDPA